MENYNFHSNRKDQRAKFNRIRHSPPPPKGPSLTRRSPVAHPSLTRRLPASEPHETTEAAATVPPAGALTSVRTVSRPEASPTNPACIAP